MIEKIAVNNFPMRTKLSRLSPPSAKSLSNRGIASLSASRSEQLDIQELIPEAAVESFHKRILPG
jgi:hypothetical protein